MPKSGVNLPKVSVVMATNAVGDFFEKAVNSVAKSKNIDWELVIVFDAVPIPSYSYIQENKRIKCIYKEHASGLPDALNLGISNASGEFIARLDSDDLMSDKRLNQQAILLFEKPEVSVVGTSVEVIDEDDRYLGTNISISGRDCRTELLKKNQLVHSSVMFRKSQWAKAQGYNSQMIQMEDYELWLRLALNGEIWNLKDTLTSYRLHQNQMSRGTGFNPNYIVPVSKARRALSNVMKMSILKFIYLDLQWKTAQILRSLKLRNKFTISSKHSQ